MAVGDTFQVSASRCTSWGEGDPNRDGDAFYVTFTVPGDVGSQLGCPRHYDLTITEVADPDPAPPTPNTPDPQPPVPIVS